MVNSDNIYPDLKLVFLKALTYPEFARPEYFIQEQKKSGWSKGVFLHSLMNVHEHFAVNLQIVTNVERSRLKKLNREVPESFGLDLNELSGGQVKGKLTKKILEDLRYAIINAYRIDKPQPVFDSYQIISFCEKMFIYIRGQFKEQIQKTSNAGYLAERQRKQGRTIEGRPEYIVYHYNIISDAPVVDFQAFRNEVRKLLLNSINPAELKTILKPLHVLGIEIVNLWNAKLQRVEYPSTDEKRELVIRDQKLIEFEYEEMTIWTRNTNSQEDFHREPNRHFMNQDFAFFAANVANLIAGEVLKEKGAKKEQKAEYKEPEDFDDLFKNPKQITPAYDILKKEELIGETGNYLGGLKSAFCVWVIELGNKGIIDYASDKTLTKLLNQRFKGLDMHDSNLRATSPKANKLYKSKFSKAMKELSQLSQLSQT